MKDRAFQEYYPEHFSHCYGCGVLNEHGLRVKSYWDGEESVCSFQPRQYHTSFPGFVYGGLIASVIDCHSTASAAAAAYRAEGRAMDTDPPLRYVTASLKVDYLLPTPLGSPLELRSSIREIKGRKVRLQSRSVGRLRHGTVPPPPTAADGGSAQHERRRPGASG